MTTRPARIALFLTCTLVATTAWRAVVRGFSKPTPNPVSPAWNPPASRKLS